MGLRLDNGLNVLLVEDHEIPSVPTTPSSASARATSGPARAGRKRSS
jgi:hypothetical protein